MMIDLIIPLAFYGFAGLTLLAAIGVVGARNPVHSVLFLILAFFGAAGLFVLLGAEIIAMLLIIVYVGAVAVLFLFVVMMLNVEKSELMKHTFTLKSCRNWLFVAVGGIGLAELVIVAAQYQISPMAIHLRAAPEQLTQAKTNAAALGAIIYTDYLYLFQVAGLVLLVAMIGAIVLTLRTREGVKRQQIKAQINRNKEDTLELKRIPIGKGVDL